MRRGVAILLIALSAALLSAGAAAAPAAQATPVRGQKVEAPLVRLINQVRAQRGLRPLRAARVLERAALLHARAMGRLGFFTHESRDGTPPSERIRRRYRGSAVGETLLWRSPDVTPEEALAMWMESPPHRRVLLSQAFGEVGVAAVHVDAAGGYFRGLDVTIVVADFGGR